MTVQVTVSTTPNENAMKFSLSCQAIESGYKTYASAEADWVLTRFSLEESLDDLYEGRLDIETESVEVDDGVAQVFLMADFITVTKKPEAGWAALEGPILQAIQASY